MYIYIVYIYNFPATDRAFETAMCCARRLVVVSTCLTDPMFPENSRALPKQRSDNAAREHLALVM